MPITAKLFTTGRSQAVRLPMEFRFQGNEVFIRRDVNTGEVVLSALFRCINRVGYSGAANCTFNSIPDALPHP